MEHTGQEDVVDGGRRSFLQRMAGLGGAIAAGALAREYGSASVPTYGDIAPRDELAERWEQAREKGKRAVAQFFGETGGAAVDIYQKLFGEEVPADSGLEEVTEVPEDPQSKITPDDPTVEEYRDALDTDSIAGEQGDLEFDDDIVLPEYQRDTTLFGEPYMQEGGEYFRRGAGDCEDYATGLASVLDGAGYDTQVVLGAVDTADERDWDMHSILEFTDDGPVYVTDTIDPWTYATRSIYEDDVVADWEPVTMFGPDTGNTVYDPQWAAS